jgi:hypothetical protein
MNHLPKSELLRLAIDNGFVNGFVMDADDHAAENFTKDLHAFYESEGHEHWRKAYQQGLDRRELIAMCFVRTLYALSALAILASLVFGALEWSASDQNTLDGYMAACKNGDAIGCLEGVQDQENGNVWARSGGSDAIHTSRIIRYRVAYRLKTGQELPER